MKFTTKADYWEDSISPSDQTIEIESRAGKIFVEGAVANMTYNGIQLRFEVKGVGVYIIFDDNPGNVRHSPPKPIAQMYKDLGGK